MSATLDGSRLKAITVSGSKLGANLASVCLGATLSLSTSQVTEMSLTFQDSPDLDLFTSKLFHPGASIRYGEWLLSCEGLSLSSGAAGPQIKINAPSKFITALRKQTGAKTWGTTPLSSWVASVAESVGMKHFVQPGLGSKAIARVKPESGQPPESTWDVLTTQARESGVWLYEYGATLVFAKPSYLIKSGLRRRTWAIVWNDFFSYSGGLTGMPQYTNDPSQELAESMTIKLASADADQARPGDVVSLTGRNVGGMGGTWIVNAVDFPMKAADVVTLTCQRPIDPVAQTVRTTAKAATYAGGVAGAAPVKGVSGGFDSFMARYNGVAIDRDGAFGAQCVDLAMQYAAEMFGVSVGGNGNQWYANGAASGAFTQIGADALPLKGDIACWGSFYGGGYGHVALVISDAGGSIRVLTQNPGPVHVDTLSKQGLQGYLRPKKGPTPLPGLDRARGPVKVV